MSKDMGEARSGGGEEMDDLREVASAHANAVTAEKKGEKTKRRRRSIRSVIAMLLATNTVLLGVLIKGAVGGPGPVAQATVPAPLMAAPMTEEVMYQEQPVVVSPPPRAQAQVGPGARSGGGSSGGRAPASRGSSGRGGAESWYAPSGGLDDIFCRPRQGETQEAWFARVPSHCY